MSLQRSTSYSGPGYSTSIGTPSRLELDMGFRRTNKSQPAQTQTTKPAAKVISDEIKAKTQNGRQRGQGHSSSMNRPTRKVSSESRNKASTTQANYTKEDQGPEISHSIHRASLDSGDRSKVSDTRGPSAAARSDRHLPLERNRIAATKCRTRKRDETSELVSRERLMEDEHRYLSSCLNSLSEEIYSLKAQLFLHSDCGCELIQTYIAGEARKSVTKLADSYVSSEYDAPEFFADKPCSAAGSHVDSQGMSGSDYDHPSFQRHDTLEHSIPANFMAQNMAVTVSPTVEVNTNIQTTPNTSTAFLPQQMLMQNDYPVPTDPYHT